VGGNGGLSIINRDEDIVWTIWWHIEVHKRTA
jgi:hypothetical protein